jgi:hypothetical protein
MTSVGADYYAIADQLVPIFIMMISAAFFISVAIEQIRKQVSRRKALRRSQADPQQAFLERYKEYRDSLTTRGAR